MVRATRSPPGSRSSIEHREAARLPLRDADIAEALGEIAGLLEVQHADPTRVQAWREAASAMRSLPRPAATIAAAEGEAGLRALPAIAPAMARATLQLALTGRCTMLDRLSGAAGPFELLSSVSGIGPELAHRIHDSLQIDDLHELEIAAYDGRLVRVPGMGPGRLRTVRGSLAQRFRRRPLEPGVADAYVPAEEPPPVAELLGVDAEYRQQGAAGTLPCIAPRRSNPRGEAWLPILHTSRNGRHYTALYADTVRAHEGTAGDQVVVYRDDAGGRGQWTVAAAGPGAMLGRRIVRGREAECCAIDAAPGASAEA
jgi:DNA polymerase (family 10)